MNVRIRPYESGDLEACRELWRQLTERHRDIYESPTIGGDAPGLHFDEHLKHRDLAGVWVAEVDGEVVGLVGLLHTGEEAEIEPVVVLEAMRSRGIGRLLLGRMEEEARRLGVRCLNIRPVARNAEAIALFVQEGFDLLGHVQLSKNLYSSQTEWRDGLRLHDIAVRF